MANGFLSSASAVPANLVVSVDSVVETGLVSVSQGAMSVSSERCEYMM